MNDDAYNDNKFCSGILIQSMLANRSSERSCARGMVRNKNSSHSPRLSPAQYSLTSVRANGNVLAAVLCTQMRGVNTTAPRSVDWSLTTLLCVVGGHFIYVHELIQVENIPV